MKPIQKTSCFRMAVGCFVGLVLLISVGFLLLISSAIIEVFVSPDGKPPPWEPPPPKPASTEPIPRPPLVLPSPLVPAYALTVRGGSGSGNYAEGKRADISANPTPVDQIFLKWTSDDSGTSFRDASLGTTFVTMPNHAVTVTANHEAVDRSFTGQCVSGKGKTKYDLKADEKRFSFYTLIEGRFLLQTEISPYEVRRIDDFGKVIEISGDDRQAGGTPSTKFRITKLADGAFKLERQEPVSGDLGLFRQQL